MGTKEEKFNDYEGFVDKFKSKLTTDDCYTPQEVYDTILDWLKKKANIEGIKIIRPFWPGGDFEKQEYPSDCIVVDNPPFSILSKIVSFFNDRNIKFFLFCPHLTCIHYTRCSTLLLTDITVEYENGAKVNTDFITNLPEFYEYAIQTCPDLKKSIALAQEKKRRSVKGKLPSYKYPVNVLSVSALSSLVRNGIEFCIPRKETLFIRDLEAMKKLKKVIYGGGLLISNKSATQLEACKKEADRLEADRLEANRLEAEKEKIEWVLSEKEQNLVKSLSN